MAGVAPHHPYGTDFDRFLYAYVGEDGNGSVVTVLSTLARLGLDPWKEASELGALSRDAASSRLSKLLASFRDVPALVRDHGSIAEKLTRLLPEHRSRVSGRSRSPASQVTPVSRGAVIAIFMILMIIAQVFLFGAWGSG